MNWKRITTYTIAVVLGLTAIGYHLVFGYVSLIQVDDNSYVLHRKNVFSQIGANVVVHTGKSETTIVDSQLGPLAAATKEKALELSNKPITRVFITHWHPDHSGGISAFSKDVQVFAHKNTMDILSKPQEGFGLTKPGSHHEFAPRDSDGLPTDSVDKQLKVANIEVVHYPNAHTNGDLVVYFEGNAAIGDLVWPGSFPFVDVHNGGSTKGLEEALKQVVERSEPGDQFIPGHGGVLSFADLTTYLEMVTETQAYVEEQLLEGKSLDEVLSLGLPNRWQDWSSDLVPESAWITMVFDSK